MYRLFLALACGSLAFAQAGLSPPSLTDRYCAGCHNDALESGGLSLAHLSAAHPERNPAEWEKVIVKLRAGIFAGRRHEPRLRQHGRTVSIALL
jgi:hypothetical protein